MPENRNPVDQNHVFPEYTPSDNSRGGYRPILGDQAAPDSAQPNYNQTVPTGQDGGFSNSNQEMYPNQNVEPEMYNVTSTNPLQNVAYAPYQSAEDTNPASPDLNQNQYFQVGVQPQVQPTKNKDLGVKKEGFSWKKLNEIISKRWWQILIGVVLVCLLGVGAYALLNRPQGFGPNDFVNVTGSIQAPQSSASGSPNRWSILIQNKESVSIQDIQVDLNFDRTFRFTSAINPDPSDPRGNQYRFASLAPAGQGTSDVLIQFEGVLSGNIDEEALMSGQITYTPSPLADQPNNRRTVPIAAARTRITSPEIRLEVSTPQQAVQNGSEAEINIIFENLSETEIKDLRLRMDYPDQGGFNYTSSELTLSTTSDVKTRPDNGNDTWFISSLPRLRQQSLKIKGNLFGAEGVRQTFVAEIAVRRNGSDYQTLATSSRDITITAQPLIVSTKIANKDSTKTFSPGENLTFEVEYQNRGTTTLQNVEIIGFIDDPANVLDYNTITFVGGDFQGNINNRTIQWRSSGASQLANVTPQTRGKFSYSIRVKRDNDFIQSALNQSAYTLTPKAQAKAQNVNQVDYAGDLYKANGDLIFEQEVKKTPSITQQNRIVYTVTWKLKTRQNQVNDVTVETTSPLPPTAWQQSSLSPADQASKISYDQTTGKISWKPGTLPSYTGISVPEVVITFDLVVETGSQGVVTLFNPVKVTGVDDFTGVNYEKDGPVSRG